MNKINKIASVALASLMFLVTTLFENNEVDASSKKAIEVYLDGSKLTFDQEPIVISGVTYIPLRNVAETTGSNVHWDSKTKLITVKDDSNNLVFEIGAEKGLLNNKEVEMPKSFVVQETKRTMVPLRFVSQNLGLKVTWVKESNSVLIEERREVINEDEVEVVDIVGQKDSTKESEYRMKIVHELQENAKKYIGTPYLYGASSNTTTYFDCSSFTQRLFAESGINLPRVSSAQFEHGEEVLFDDLQAGDLMFFDTAGKGTITHVAIYIDENTLLHATVSLGVDYTTYSKYWQDRFLSAASVIN